MVGEGSLERASWGLRFVDATTERAYRSWATVAAIPFIRAGMLASIASWAFGSYGVLTSVSVTIPWFIPAVGALYAWFFLTLLLSYLPSRRGLLFAFTAVANAVAGLLLIAVALQGFAPHIALSGMCLVNYFAFTIFRLPIRYAMAAAAVYVVTFEALTLSNAFPVLLSPTDEILYSIVLLIAYATGTIAVIVVEQVARDNFAQGKVIEGQRLVIEQERERADRLLHNVLPEEIAARLKISPGVIAERFDAVSVLFADVVGFTPMAAKLSPEELVAVLNEVFTRFDALATQYGVEKIKTIGDAYMAVAGVPKPRTDHAAAVADLALAMCLTIAEARAKTGFDLRLRIGICSGPAVAGVIGTRKFAYDLWGDTVNTAARMESHGLADGIQVSESTFSALGAAFLLEARGAVEIKGKGPMQTWLLKGRVA
jgi:guanylate cyclase